MASSSDEDTLALIAVHLLNEKKKKKIKPKSVWVRQWILRRPTSGAYHSLLGELQKEDPLTLRNFLRMDSDNFHFLLKLVQDKIEKRSTPMRNAISAGEKLAITLRFLASGDSYKSLEYLYRMPRNTISQFIPEVCQAIYERLHEDYVKVPNSEEEWLGIQEEFMSKWDFPNCIGALDGKHVAIKAPNNSGSTFFNYKKFFSIILLALVDANCRFIYVDVGTNGRAGDAGVYANSDLSQALENNSLHIPEPKCLPGRQEPVPSVVVGDDACMLKPYLMKPYPMKDLSLDKRIFNYRLSRARRVSENAFGILTNRFAIFQRPLQVSPDTAVSVVLACIAIHNFLKKRIDVVYMNESEMETSACKLTMFHQQGGNRNAASARQVRDELADYFITNGQADWQWDMV